MSYDEWLTFTFDLDPRKRSLAFGTYPGSASETLGHCITFFQSPRFVLERFPREFLCEAFRLIPSIDGYLRLLALPEISLQQRFQLVDAPLPLFANLSFH